VAHISDLVMVMYLGRIIEEGPADWVLKQPLHPYTQGLLGSVPGAGRNLLALKGEPPSPVNPPSGCSFRTRCPMAIDPCAHYDQAVTTLSGSKATVRCLRAGEDLSRVS
jgi:oligopeptide/dipeptide ABC transporter ATP-binding protein